MISVKILIGLALEAVLMSCVLHMNKELGDSAREQCQALPGGSTDDLKDYNNASQDLWRQGHMLGAELQQLALDIFPCGHHAPNRKNALLHAWRFFLVSWRVMVQGPWRHHDWAFCCLTLYAPAFVIVALLLAAVHGSGATLRSSRRPARTNTNPTASGVATLRNERGNQDQRQDDWMQLAAQLQKLAAFYQQLYFLMPPLLSCLNTWASVASGGSPGMMVHWHNSRFPGFILAIPLVMVLFKVWMRDAS